MRTTKLPLCCFAGKVSRVELNLPRKLALPTVREGNLEIRLADHHIDPEEGDDDRP